MRRLCFFAVGSSHRRQGQSLATTERQLICLMKLSERYLLDATGIATQS